MPPPTWIVSRSGGSGSSSAKVVEACRRLGVPHAEVQMVPFSPELPPIPSDADMCGPIVFYGQTSLVLAALASPYSHGVFFDPEMFRPSVYLRHLGSLMLNSDQEPTTIRDLANSPRPNAERIFLRPDDDLKGFSGQTMAMSEFRAWRASIGETTDGEINADTPIVVASPKEIGREYRAVVVDGRIVSLVATDGRGAAPSEVEILVKAAVSRWQPVRVSVIDVAETEVGPRVIELNCFNASGLYVEDAASIVRAVSEAAAIA